MVENLCALVKELRNKIRSTPSLKLEFSDNGLALSFNPEKGLRGYEIISAVPNNNLYEVSYFGIAPLSFETFLRPRNQTLIKKSPLLSKFQEQVNEVYQNPGNKKKGYIHLVSLTEHNRGYTEIEEALNFFCIVFKGKASYSQTPE